MFRSRKSRRYVSRPKRNAERVIRGGVSAVGVNTQQTAYTYTAAEACTVKSIKLDIGMTAGQEFATTNVPYVVVVVREGYNANSIVWPAINTDLYNPTMDVLISGVLTDGGVEDHKYNAIGRKLKAGDRLCLLYYAVLTDGSNATVTFEMNFSVLTQIN